MISFQNKGLIDLRAVRTFGASSKEGSNPVGFFGTGLKYAISVCLRHDCTVTLYRGLEKFEFTSKQRLIRKDLFDVVCMNDEELGFTTHLGVNWQLWAAFRELYCNTKDEDGEVLNERVAPEEDCTTIHVTGRAFDQLWYERDRIFLPKQEPMATMPGIEVYPQPSQYAYYRGIRVVELPHPSQRTYNILQETTLTEDRTLYGGVYMLAARLGDGMLWCANEDLLREFLTAPRGTYEYEVDVHERGIMPAPVILRVLKELRRDANLRTTGQLLYSKYLASGGLDYQSCELNAHEALDFEHAKKLCKTLGVEINRYPIAVTEDLPDHVWGQAHVASKKIFLSRRVFNMGPRMVAGTLFEEYVHLARGLRDETRAFQNFLIDLLFATVERLESS